MPYDDDYCQDTPWIVAPTRAIKGRGATINITGRYDVQHSESVDDGW